MCTAITYQSGCHYFGRNLDLEYIYQEVVTITPRNFPLLFRMQDTLSNHYAMIGMATVADGYPLYYEATNEKGLSMAGLNFPGIATYLPAEAGKINVTPFEFIPWILGQFETLTQVRKAIKKINLVNISFSEKMPLSPLHWIISDKTGSITVEPMADGLHIFDNPIGVLTNNPPFDYHLYNLRNYLNITAEPATNRFSELEIKPYSSGMGGIGLPGDFSSASRFVKAAFVKLNAVSESDEVSSVSQFFHILSSVAMPRGCVRINGKYDITQYACCCNTDLGIYYYTTYDNPAITGIDMHREDLDGISPISYPLAKQTAIIMQN